MTGRLGLRETYKKRRNFFNERAQLLVGRELVELIFGQEILNGGEEIGIDGSFDRVGVWVTDRELDSMQIKYQALVDSRRDGLGLARVWSPQARGLVHPELNL